MTEGPFIKPLPLPKPRGVTVFLVSTFNPTIGSNAILGFLGRRSVFSNCFLLVDRLDELVPLEGWPSTCFFKVACYLIYALILAASIFA